MHTYSGLFGFVNVYAMCLMCVCERLDEVSIGTKTICGTALLLPTCILATIAVCMGRGDGWHEVERERERERERKREREREKERERERERKREREREKERERERERERIGEE